MLAAFMLAATAACGGGDDGDGGTNPTPGITVAVGSATATVNQGASTTVPVTITRTGGFAGAVDLAVSGAPDGVTATLDPATIAAGSTSSTLTIAVGEGVAAGNYPLTITASGDDVADKTATVTLTVAAAQTQTFSLAADPAALGLVQGETKTSTVTITRGGGFTGAVALAAASNPAGLTLAVDPASATGNTATVSVTAPATLAAGNYQVTVTGTATGLANQTATIAVTVTASSGSGSNSISFCADDAPIWVATRDGTGAWTQATATNGTYSVNFASGKGGIAYVTQNDAGTSFDTQVIYATKDELTAAAAGAASTQLCTPSTEAGKTVTGTVAGVGEEDVVFVTLGTSSAFAIGATGGAFTLNNVPDGEQTLIASRATSSETGLVVNKIIIRRGLNPANNSALPVLDFGAAEAFDPASADLTIENIGGDEASVGVSFLTGGSGFFGGAFSFLFNTGDITSANNVVTYYGVPTGQLAAGDLHMLQAFASPPGDNPTSSRFAMQFFREVIDRTLTLGSPLADPTVAVGASTPYLRINATLPKQAEYDQLAFGSFDQSGAAPRSVSVSMSAGYLGGDANFDLSIPDFSGVTGFDNTWGLQAGVETSWDVSAVGGTFAFGFLGARPTDGSTVLFAGRNGSIGAASGLRARRVAAVRH